MSSGAVGTWGFGGAKGRVFCCWCFVVRLLLFVGVFKHVVAPTFPHLLISFPFFFSFLRFSFFSFVLCLVQLSCASVTVEKSVYVSFLQAAPIFFPLFPSHPTARNTIHQTRPEPNLKLSPAPTSDTSAASRPLGDRRSSRTRGCSTAGPAGTPSARSGPAGPRRLPGACPSGDI